MMSMVFVGGDGSQVEEQTARASMRPTIAGFAGADVRQSSAALGVAKATAMDGIVACGSVPPPTCALRSRPRRAVQHRST